MRTVQVKYWFPDFGETQEHWSPYSKDFDISVSKEQMIKDIATAIVDGLWKEGDAYYYKMRDYVSNYEPFKICLLVEDIMYALNVDSLEQVVFFPVLDD